MRGFRERLVAGWIVVIGGLVLLLSVAGLTACGGGGEEASMPIVASEEDVEIGKVIQSEGWELTITKAPEKVTVVGKGDVVHQAEGMFAIVPVKATNLGKEMQIIPRDRLRLIDAQGREFHASGVAIHTAYALPRGIEFSYPVHPQASRESIIIFDVPTDATGLTMTIEGTDESLDLGF